MMVNNSYVIVIPVKKTGSEIIPFEKVKEQCKSELMKMKLLEFDKEKNKAIKEIYNIIQPGNQLRIKNYELRIE